MKNIDFSGFSRLFAFMRKNTDGNLYKKNSAPKTAKCRKNGGEGVAKSNEEKIYENMKSLEEWALAGISQKEMAEMLGMAYSTFRDLKKKIPALSALLKKSADFLKAEKKKQVEQVEKTLFERCMGYNADVTKHYKLKKPMLDEAGEIVTVSGKVVMTEELKEVTETQHIPADVGAIKFFLMNQARADWQNDPERLAIEKKRLANDTKRTKLAEQNANGLNMEGKTVEDYLEEAESAELEERAAGSTAAEQQKEGGGNG